MKTRVAWWTIGVMICGLILMGCRDEDAAANAQDGVRATVTPSAERVVGGLREPVALVFLSRTQWLVAERRAGVIRWVENGQLRQQPFATVSVPNPAGYHEYGLLGLALDPDYPDRPYVYAFHTVAGVNNRAAGQRIVRFTVRDGRGVEPHTIVDNLPAGTACCHNGGRLLFGQDGMLYVSLGDTQQQDMAQQPTALPGKILRYTQEGTIPADNPFTTENTEGGVTRSPVYTMGHRNPFGMALHPETGNIYITENGPDRGDEINRLVAGDNYGWPVVVGSSEDPRFRAPLWATGRDVIAPTGAAFYTGTEFPQFHNQLLFAAYIDGRLRRAVLDGPDKLTVHTVPEAGANAYLDVAMGLDGRLYFTSKDAIYRLRPAE